MIKTEYIGKNGLGVDLYRTYSDENKYILQIETGNEYDEAIDVADKDGNIAYTYEETEKYVEEETIELPDIALNKDTNIIEVDTTRQPSKMAVTYLGKK